MKTSKTLKLLLAAFAAVALISSVQAASFDITVGGVTTSIGIPPNSFNGTIGAFDIALTAMSNPVPPPANPALDLAGGVSYHGSGPADITLCVTGDGFVPLTSLVGGVGGAFQGSGGTIFQTILANGVPATTNTVTLTGPFSTFASGLANITPSSAPFSLEDCVTIHFNGAGFVSFDAGVFRGPGVPDSGATVTLLGLGLLAIAGVAKLRAAKVAA